MITWPIPIGPFLITLDSVRDKSIARWTQNASLDHHQVPPKGLEMAPGVRIRSMTLKQPTMPNMQVISFHKETQEKLKQSRRPILGNIFISLAEVNGVLTEVFI